MEGKVAKWEWRSLKEGEMGRGWAYRESFPPSPGC